jgi:hypothetical protein
MVKDDTQWTRKVSSRRRRRQEMVKKFKAKNKTPFPNAPDLMHHIKSPMLAPAPNSGTHLNENKSKTPRGCALSMSIGLACMEAERGVGPIERQSVL